MQQKLALSIRGWGRQLLATATLLVLPVAAIAWLSPGLVTAADGAGAGGLLAFEAAAVTATVNLQAEESAVTAQDWAFTKTAAEKQAEKDFKEQQKQEKKEFKECQKDQKKSFKETGTASPATCLP